MKRALRDISGLLLAALVTIAALHVGAVRGQAEAVDSVVLCIRGTPVVVSVDADGQPAGHAPHCPECVMTVLAGPDAPDADVPCAVRVRRLVPGRSRATGRSRAGRGFLARGPPRRS